jgi:hypothetical protein
MNYLNSPICPFAIDWDDAVQRSITLDLRSTALGFGAEYFTPTADYTVNGWEFSLCHKDGNDLLAFESFADSLTGRLNGFWLPCPLQTAVFADGISTTQFNIVGEGLADTWNSRPDQHLLFTFPDSTQAAAQVTGVTATGQTEQVTLATPLPQVPPPGTVITRLHYVRFADDSEQLDFLAEGVATMKLSVVELPLEYTNAATGLQPIYLYHFWMEAPVATDWYFTSFAAPVVSNGKVYRPWPMSHGEIKQTTDGNSNPVDITAKPDPTHPFSLLAGVPPGKVLWCDISLCCLPNPDAAKKIFSGFASSVVDDGIKYTAHCDTRLAWLKTKLPRFYVGTLCNWTLFDPNTCQVTRAYFETTVTLTGFIDGSGSPGLQCTFNFGFQQNNWQAQNWFQGGTLEAGAGLNYELRSIVASSWDNVANVLELTLNAPLIRNTVGSELQITAGCDHTSGGPNGCIVKFNNFPNFGGFVDVPDQNLSLQGLNSSVSQGNKKAS